MSWIDPKVDWDTDTPITDTHLNNIGNDLLWLHTAHGINVFTADGTFTVPDNITTVYVSMCGGGGGGKGGSYYYGSHTVVTYYVSAGGGGAEAVFKKAISVTAGELITVTIGSGGTVGNSGNASSFGSYLTCVGGGGGSVSINSSGSGSATPGAAGGPGGRAGGGWLDTIGHYVAGGGCLLGPGGFGAGTTYGSGGGATGTTGYAGGDGVCIVEW